MNNIKIINSYNNFSHMANFSILLHRLSEGGTFKYVLFVYAMNFFVNFLSRNWYEKMVS